MRLVDVILLCVGLTMLIVGVIGVGAASPESSGCNFKDNDAAGDKGQPCYAGLPPDPEAPDAFADPMSGEIRAAAFPADEKDNASVGIVFHNWRGFALKGNESHALRVSIESIRPIEPMSVRKLLASNMSIDEVRDEIRREEGSVMHQGVMKMGDEVYMLANVNLSSSDNYTLLEADLAGQRLQGPQNETASLGHISAKLADQDDAEVSAGTLVIHSGQYAGQYKVLLNAQGPERMVMSVKNQDQGGNINGRGPD